MGRLDTTSKATGVRKSRYQRSSRRLPRLGDSARASIAGMSELRIVSPAATGKDTDQGLCEVCGDPATTRYKDELRCGFCSF